MFKALKVPGVMIAVSFITITLAAISPRKDDTLVGVIFPPAVSQEDAFKQIVKAGGRVVTIGALPRSFIVERPNATFTKTIMRTGAFLVFRAETGWGCATPVKRTALG